MEKGQKRDPPLNAPGFPKGEKMVDSAFASGFGKLCRNSCLSVIKGPMCNTIAHPPYGLAMGMGFSGFSGRRKKTNGVGRIREYFVRFYFNVARHVFLKILPWKGEKA